MICPLPLPLETRKYSIMSKCFFTLADLFELRIADHEISGNECHLNNSFPFLVFLFSGLWRRVEIFSFFAVSLCPFKSFYEFIFIKNLLVQPAVEFTHINILVPHSEIFLEKILAYN